jgi:5-methylcytosine-specific restriction protein A
MTKFPMIDNPLGGRPVREWVGKTPQSMPPQSVRVRIFRRAGGLCHWSGQKIEPGDKWQADHIKRLADGGANCESNLAPILVEPHKEKSKAENKAGKKADRVSARHTGAADQPKQPIKSDPHALKSRRRPTHEGRESLPPRAMFVSLGDIASDVLAKLNPKRAAE